MISRGKRAGALNREQKELKPHGTKGFPCAGYDSCYTDNPEDFLPWHWHEEMEIIYIAEGALRVKIPSGIFFSGKRRLSVFKFQCSPLCIG